MSSKSDVTAAIQYALGRWDALTLYCEDGRVEMDNNAAERALRAVALGRKNYLFAGSDAGGERAAAIYSLIGSAKLNGIDMRTNLIVSCAICRNVPSFGVTVIALNPASLKKRSYQNDV